MRSTTRICFVHHGETGWNVEQRMQGTIDLALSATGLAQAAAVGRHFSTVPADALYSSDLLRARQTAQPIARLLACVARLLGDHCGQGLVVVTHGGVLGLSSNAP